MLQILISKKEKGKKAGNRKCAQIYGDVCTAKEGGGRGEEKKKKKNKARSVNEAELTFEAEKKKLVFGFAFTIGKSCVAEEAQISAPMFAKC